jgi:hypothetical protein
MGWAGFQNVLLDPTAFGAFQSGLAERLTGVSASVWLDNNRNGLQNSAVVTTNKAVGVDVAIGNGVASSGVHAAVVGEIVGVEVGLESRANTPSWSRFQRYIGLNLKAPRKWNASAGRFDVNLEDATESAYGIVVEGVAGAPNASRYVGIRSDAPVEFNDMTTLAGPTMVGGETILVAAGTLSTSATSIPVNSTLVRVSHPNSTTTWNAWNLAPGVDGQLITVLNVGTTTIPVRAGANLHLPTTVNLARFDSMNLIWIQDAGKWVLVSQSNPPTGR